MDELALYRKICDVTCQGDAQSLLERALDAAIALSGAEAGHLVLAAPDGASLGNHYLARGGPPEVSHGILARAIEEGQSLLLENARAHEDFQHLESVQRLQLLSVLVVPVREERRVLAALYLVNSSQVGVFRASDQALLEAFAARIAPALRAALEHNELRRACDAALLRKPEGGETLIGSHPAFLQVLDQVAKVAPTEVPVLFLGKSGTGKELLAHAVHQRSKRCDGPMITLNCGAIPESLLESELFGHEKGAFTGARARAGKFAAADGGTIFLDEVGELSLQAQVRLLRVLQSGEIQRVGSDRSHHVDVRVVSATNRPLRELVAELRFREDLFYRLGVISIHVPPLCMRGEDVLLLADHFLRRHAAAMGMVPPALAPASRKLLLEYGYPGNVRELENLMRRALVFGDGPKINPEHLPAEVSAGSAASCISTSTPRTRKELKQACREAIHALERAFCEQVLRDAQGNVSQAARQANMHRTSLHELLKRHGLEGYQFKEG